MKNVLIISYAFPPLSIAGTFRPMRFVRHLRKFGWEPTVISVEGREDLPRDETLLSQIPKGLKVYRTKAWGPSTLRIMNDHPTAPGMKRFENNDFSATLKRIRRDLIHSLNNMISIPDPLIYWVPKVVELGKELGRKIGFDAVLTTSPPHSTHFAGLILSRQLGLPWISDFRDPWVDNIYFEGKKGRLRRYMEEWLERLIMRSSAGTIANTEPNRRSLLDRYHGILPPAKVVTITNGFDRDFMNSIPPKKFDKFTLCHSGALYSLLDTHFIFEAFARWLETIKSTGPNMPPAQFVFIGTNEAGLRPIIDKYGIQDHVHFISRVSHETAISYTKAADLLLVNIGLKENEKASGWIPLKIYDYLGCRKPILGILPDRGAAAEIIRSNQSGYVVSEPDHRSVADILSKHYRLYMNNNLQTPLLNHNPELDQYEVVHLTRKLADVLEEACFQHKSNGFIG